MFTLVNEYGNVYKTVNTEREKNELLGRGYKEVEKKLKLDKLTVEQLEKIAAEKKINLEGCNNKAEKLERIKAALVG